MGKRGGYMRRIVLLVTLLRTFAVANAALTVARAHAARHTCRHSGIILAGNGASGEEDDVLSAFAAKLRKDQTEKEEEQKVARFASKLQSPRKKGLGPAREGREELPIRLGGAVRDGSLGELRAAINGLSKLSVRDWGAEEYGLAGFFVLLIGTAIISYNVYVKAPSESPTENYVPPTKLNLCLARSFGFSEKLLCRVKFSDS